MPKKTLTHAISARLDKADYNRLVHDAELKNRSVAGHVRQIITEHETHKSIEQTLLDLERRMASRTFSIVCAVANLSEHEREIVKARITGDNK